MVQYLTEKEIADKWHTNKRNVAKWRKNGLICGLKPGRQWIYREDEIECLFEELKGLDISADRYLNIRREKI